MEGLISGFLVLADPYLLALLVMATLGGVVIGALPGLNATTGAALLLPFTLTMDPVPAISIMTAIYCSATFAGAITAILINTPGPLPVPQPASTAIRWPSVEKQGAPWAWLLSPRPSAASLV